MLNNNASESDNNPVLPHDIIVYDILTRVPTDSVVRFTCVCKPWSKLLLQDKRFANLHKRNSPSSSPPGIVDCKFDKNTRKCYLSLFDVDKKKRKIIRFKPETDYRADNMKIQQSFNGLLLFRRCVNQRNSVYDYIVYNPITGRSVNLPVPVGVQLEDCEFCLAYDPVGESYKAVCFGGNYDQNFCKILTLGECGRDTWRNLLKPGFRFDKPLGFPESEIVFSYGVLYWITEKPETVKRTICSACVSTETLYTIQVPKDASLIADCHLVEMGGLLCYYELNHVDKQIKVWVMEKNIDNWCGWVRKGNIELARSFQNAVRVLPYDQFQHMCYLLEIVTNPKPKIIFLWWGAREDDGDAHMCYEYYSCDVESNKIELILGSKMDGKGEWHLKSLAYI